MGRVLRNNATERVNGQSRTHTIRTTKPPADLTAGNIAESIAAVQEELGKKSKPKSHSLPDRVEAEIPRLRRYARSLTRDVVAADDLVQDALMRGLAKLHLWQEGTNLRAWLFTILHNQYVNQIRRQVREGAPLDLSVVEPVLYIQGNQQNKLELRDLDRALAKLPAEQRRVILYVGLQGMSYDAVAELEGVPVGTVRSRLSRGRETLRRLMGDINKTTKRSGGSANRQSAKSANTGSRAGWPAGLWASVRCELSERFKNGETPKQLAEYFSKLFDRTVLVATIYNQLGEIKRRERRLSAAETAENLRLC